MCTVRWRRLVEPKLKLDVDDNERKAKKKRHRKKQNHRQKFSAIAFKIFQIKDKSYV